MSSKNINEEKMISSNSQFIETYSGDEVEFWKQYLGKYDEIVSIPKNNNNIKAYNEEKVSIKLDEKLTEKLMEIGKIYKVSLQYIILGAWALIVQRYTSCDDMVFGEIINCEDNRNEKSIYLIPRRVKLNEKSSFIENVKVLSQQMEQCDKFKNVPFVDMVNCTNLKAEIIDNVIYFKNKYLNHNAVNELQSRLGLTKRDLILAVDIDKDINIECNFNRQIYNTEFIETILKYFNEANMKISKMYDENMDKIDIMTLEDKKKILINFNDTFKSYDKNMTINRAFENQAKKTPNEIAIKFNDIEISYDFLNKKANCLAERLKNHGVGRGTIIPLICKRSIDMVVAMLGILKAGAAYLPIDPSYPSNRIEYMIKDSSANIIMVDNEEVIDFNYDGRILNINEYEEDFTLEGSRWEVSSSDLAYVIYTSGSTGKPKGVMIEHKSVYNFIEGLMDEICFKGKTLLSLTTISFDIFVVEVLASLTNGIKIILANELQQTDTMMIGNLIFDEEINIIQTTPSRLKMIFEDSSNTGKLDSITDVLSGGEGISLSVVNLIKSKINAKIYNCYGPTEATVYASIAELRNKNKVFIGKPMNNVQMYILDNKDRVVPFGAIGELYIGGDGVARGYYKRDDLTKVNFRDIEFDTYDNKFTRRVYKTGDLVIHRDDGNIEYLGRIDNQIKIRGYRIELGEIEGIIQRYNGIAEVTVTYCTDSEENKFLCAYMVSSRAINFKELRKYLLKYLPDYMIPTYFMLIDKIPLTPNNKVDRKALPNPSIENSCRQEYQAPKTNIECILVNIWEEVFGINKISVDDGFFDLGGYSLRAMRIVAKAKSFGMNLKVNDIFYHSTIRNIAKIINNNSNVVSNVENAAELLYKKYGIISKWTSFTVNGEENKVLFLESRDKIDMNQILSFMSNNFSEDIIPHYIKEGENSSSISNKNFQTMLGLNKITGQEIRKVCDKIEFMINKFEYNILSNMQINEFPISPVQEYTLKYSEFEIEGMVIKLPGLIKINALNKAINSIIKFQPLLRSKLKNIDGNLYWNELKYPERLEIAAIDISQYDHISKKLILDTIARKYYSKKFNLLNSLPFRIILVNLNIKESLLLISFSHLVFDGQSGEIFKSKIMQYYNFYLYHSEEIYGKMMDYNNYVNFITDVPKNIDDDTLYREFDLDKFNSNIVKINKKIEDNDYSKPTFYEYVISKNDLNSTNNEFNPWNEAFGIVCRFCNNYFNEVNIPMWIATYGRRYKSWSDFETIGEFIDSVPIVLNIAGSNIESLEKQVRNKIESLALKDINIFNLIFNKQATKVYPLTSAELKKQMNTINIYFNFQGEFQGDERKLKDEFLNKRDNIIVKNITFTSWYTEDSIYMRLMLPYKEDIKKIKSIFEDNNTLTEEISKEDMDICFG